MQPTTDADRNASHLTPRLRAILAVVLLAAAVDLMDSTITNIAAPTIVRELGGGESLVKWLGTSYALSLGVLLVVGGRLGDRFGQRGCSSSAWPASASHPCCARSPSTPRC